MGVKNVFRRLHRLEPIPVPLLRGIGVPKRCFMSRHPRNAIRSLALVLALQPVVAAAQNFGNVPANSVIGRGASPVGGGPAQAIPFSQLIATMLSGPLTVPSVNTNSIVFAGSTSGTATLSAQNVAGAANIKLPTTSGTLADSASSPLALDPVSGVLTCPTCATTASAGAAAFVASRAIAAGLDLHISNVIQTGGYALPGDGGGAIFQNVGTTPFIDSFIASGTIAGGSGCTNGTYFGVGPSGGTGPGLFAVVTVAGSVVTAVNFAGSPGNAYSVNDVLTLPSAVIGCSNASITVTGVTFPQASFIDSVGTHFQYIPDQAAVPNVKQFGAKGDWNGVDGAATDNFISVQAAVRYATYKSTTSFDAGGFWGGRVVIPSGSYMLCGATTASLIVPNGIILEGASPIGSTLKMCNTFNPAVHFIELCDPNWHFACFNSMLHNLELMVDRSVSAANTVAVVHTNAAQDFGGLSYVYIYAGQRSCSWFEKGFGGASQVIYDHVSCTAAGSNIMMRFGNSVASGLNYGSTNLDLKNLVLGGPSSGTLQTQPGILLQGGFYTVENVHCEEIPVCIEIGIPASGNGDQVSIRNVNAGGGGGGSACTGTIQLDSTNVPGNTQISQVPGGSCTNVVTNSQSGGTNRTAAIVLPVTFP
jgi:hypothetical protein